MDVRTGLVGVRKSGGRAAQSRSVLHNVGFQGPFCETNPRARARADFQRPSAARLRSAAERIPNAARYLLMVRRATG